MLYISLLFLLLFSFLFLFPFLFFFFPFLLHYYMFLNDKLNFLRLHFVSNLCLFVFFLKEKSEVSIASEPTLTDKLHELSILVSTS